MWLGWQWFGARSGWVEAIANHRRLNVQTAAGLGVPLVMPVRQAKLPRNANRAWGNKAFRFLGIDVDRSLAFF